MSSATVAPQPRPRRKRRLQRRETLWFYIFISPWILGFLFFQAGPILAAAYFSVSDLTDLNLSNLPHLVGFVHYQKLFTSLAFLQFRDGLRATAIYVGVGVPVRIIVALAVAQLLNQKIPFLRVLRTLYYMPTVVAGVAAALLWLTLLDPTDGILNEALMALHLPHPDWLAGGDTAMEIMIIYSAWYLGTAMVIFLAGLQGVPTELYEAAAIDGAGPIRRFWHISLPQISPVILFATVIGVINALQEFVAPFVLTGGGGPIDATRLIGLDLYENAIVYTYPGHGAAASAESMFMFGVAMIITLVIFLISRQFVYYAGEREGGL
ncbi:MAG TPA: sugar ABC transporter permease [Chloroflexota bacterium]|nr:sugar ABC transporter permease [Chloroflexota bacterium]